MPLTDREIRTAKPADKPRKLFDGGGLFLEIRPNGGKWWRLKYRFGGKEKLLALDTYPTVSLREARERRDDAKKLLTNGIDPGERRKVNKIAASTANSFEAVAHEWFAKQEPTWAKNHSSKIIARLQRDVFPWLGNIDIADVKAPDILPVVQRIEERGAIETAHRALQNIGQIMRYAVATGRADRDPAADLRGALQPTNEKHYPAITDPKQIGELLRAIDNFQGQFTTVCALKLAPLLFVRPGELRKAEWSEIDFDQAEWRIPAEKMKGKEPLIVPLAPQAIVILRDLYALTGRGKYLFPSIRSYDRPMSENTVNAALRRLGYAQDEMTGHGFRAMARTVLDEQLGFRPEYIEQQLGHAVRDPLGRAYNRTKHLPQRRKMMIAWADYLDGLKYGADVVPIQATA